MSIMLYDKPHFVIKQCLQKSKQTGVYFSDVLTPSVLLDVVKRITGKEEFSYEYVDNDYQDEFLSATYNKGRLAILHWNENVMYISFSEKDINGRNSSVQSVPTAFNMFYSNPYPQKRLFYYFLNVDGNPETDYHILIYRLMETIGFEFLNPEVLQNRILPFLSIDDIMLTRRVNSGRNQSNNSTYITKSTIRNIDIYGKTYGANKYETSLICYALSLLVKPGQHITLYEVLEKDLKELPEASMKVIQSMGVINVVPTDMQLEKRAFEENNSLRSPRYVYNLLGRLGKKRCALCGCEIPEIIQGAHIWPVAEIKKAGYLSLDDKIFHAISGENGVWLCENHHKLFDENLLTFTENGTVLFSNQLDRENALFLEKITTIRKLPDTFMTDNFISYIRKRNQASA